MTKSDYGITINSTAYDDNIDIYVRYNQSMLGECITKNEFRSQNYTLTSSITAQSLIFSNLTENNQKIIQRLNSSAVSNIWTYTDIDCSGTVLIEPWFCFSSMCSDCVITNDAQDDCNLLE